MARRLATALWDASLSPCATSAAAAILHELHRDNALRRRIELTPRQARTVLEALEKLN